MYHTAIYTIEGRFCIAFAEVPIQYGSFRSLMVWRNNLITFEVLPARNPNHSSINAEGNMVAPVPIASLHHESLYAPRLHGWMDMCLTIRVDSRDGNVGRETYASWTASG